MAATADLVVLDYAALAAGADLTGAIKARQPRRPQLLT
jgi:hypothetical protein